MVEHHTPQTIDYWPIVWWPITDDLDGPNTVAVISYKQPVPEVRGLCDVSWERFGDRFNDPANDPEVARWLRDVALELLSTYRVHIDNLFDEFAKIPEWRNMKMRGYRAFLPCRYDRPNLYNGPRF